VADQSEDAKDAIMWKRVRSIFGNAEPPSQVWERQFDYNDDDLERLAATPYREINRDDLWYYFHDLAYVELQPELFAYLFPVCLMEWHDTLMRNESCAKGDSEFHYGIRQGHVFEKMLTARQRSDVCDFFRDSFLARLDGERGFHCSGMDTSAYGWMGRLNSLGLVVPRIDSLWIPWWNVQSPGRAVCVLQYCSGLIYLVGDNPAFDAWTPERGGGVPLWANDSHLHDAAWLPPNLEFLQETLSVSYVLYKVEQAAKRLAGQPEDTIARQIAFDAARNQALIESRLVELPVLLKGERPNGPEGWSV
jgi:hypothetical protein